MEIIDKKSFFEIIKQMETIPFPQGRGWDQYMNDKSNSIYFVDNYSAPTICCRGEVYKKPFIGSILRIQGEAMKDPNQETIRNFYTEISRMEYSLVLVSSFSLYNTDYEIGIRQAGFVRPLHQTTCPLTILIDTINRPVAHRTWKRNIKKAITAGCTFRIIKDPGLDESRIFTQIFKEMAIKKNLSYSLDEQDIYKLLQDPAFRLFFIYNPTGTVISGRIVYVDGKQAWDVYAANSNDSRQNGASYYIIEEILQYLATQNIGIFDFGRIGPGTNTSNQVYLFKQSSGGYPVQYNGEWTFVKNKYSELLMLIYRYVLKGSTRY